MPQLRFTGRISLFSLSDVKKILVVSLAALLSACAPSQMGVGVSAPQVMASPMTPVTVRPGQALYVRYSYPRTLLKVDDAPFRALEIDFGSRDNSSNVHSASSPVSWLSVTPQDLPPGVDVALAQAFVAKEIVGTTHPSSGATSVNYYERVWVTLKVTAAPTARAGAPKVGTLVYSHDGTQSEVPLLVRVDGGGTGSPSVQ